jgi:hypothetical protein
MQYISQRIAIHFRPFHEFTIKSVHAACPYLYCMFMLHVLAHAACLCLCSMSMSMLHAHANAECPCRCWMSLSMKWIFNAMQHGLAYAVWTWPCRFKHGHAAWTWTCRIYTDIQHGLEHAALTWTCSMYLKAALTWTCSMDMDMWHGHAHVEHM